jgi:predicted dehydrogenase
VSTRVLVVGLGGIGCAYDAGSDPDAQVHSHARAFGLHPAFELIGGVDPDPARRDAFLSATGVEAHAGLADALSAGDPDLVVIATPTGTHAAVLADVLARATPKAVLCEKPLAPEPAAAREMVEACAARGVDLFVNYFRRSLPGLVEVRGRLARGDIAPGGTIVSWYSKGFLHNGSHLFDLIVHLLGAPRAVTPLGPPRPGVAPEEIDCQLRFDSGQALLLGAWEEHYSLFTLELVAPNGRLRFETDGALTWQGVVPHPALPDYHVLGEPEPIRTDFQRYQWHVADQLARHFDRRSAALCGGREALQTLENMCAALAAARGVEA